MPHQRAAGAPPVYLDYAATTPVRAEVREAIEPLLRQELTGNAASAHRFGRAARSLIEHARRRVADALDADPRHVVFTSGGTEGDNMAIVGAVLAARRAGRPLRVAVGSTEHKAVLAAAQAITAFGGQMVALPVDEAGRIDLEAVERELAGGLAVLSVMWVNNETGTIQDIAAIAARATDAGVPFHTDAVQAIGKVPCSFANPNITMLAASGHKIWAPQGTGVLLVRDRAVIDPLFHGGGQQAGMRPGTENVVGSVAMATAVELAVREVGATAAATQSLRDDLERRLAERLPGLVVHSATTDRAPHISNVSVPGAESDALLLHLDLAGIACSSGSACLTGTFVPSHVLSAMGVAPDVAGGSLRFSLSKASRPSDVDRVVTVLPDVAATVRELGSRLAS